MRCITSLLAGLLTVMQSYAEAAPLPHSNSPGGSRSDISILAQTRNSITGFVFDEHRNPIPEVYVELYSDMGSPLSRTKASSVGTYSFRGLADGVFVLRVLPYGKNYVQQEKRVNLFSISARPGSGGVSEQVDFYLQARRASVNPLGSPGVVFVQEVPKKAEALYLEGVNLLDDKRENEGLTKLRESIEEFPTYFAALDRLGGEYVLRKHYRPAYVLLTSAIAVNPKSHSSWLGLGITQFRLELPRDSLNSLQRAYELQPDSLNGLLWYGIALHSNQRLVEALMMLEKANRLGKGKLSDVNFQMARVLKDQGKYREAAQQLELVLAKNPKAENAEDLKKMIALLRAKG